MQNDATIQEAARNLFEGVVPERKKELSGLWAQYSPRFNILADAGPEGLFVLDAGAYRDVRFNHRAMRAFWLASFIAWEGYRAVAVGYEAQSIDLTNFREMVETFNKTLKEEELESVPLPEGIPEPGVYPNGNDFPQMRAAAELATFATGWALLHEVRHLMHQQDSTGAIVGDPAKKRHEEELSCDSYATTFLLGKVEEYASAEKVSAEKVRQKREIGIYFALFAMSLIGAGHWAASDSHPAMEARIDAVMRQMGSNGTRPSDAIAHMAFVALWTLWPDAPGPFKVQ